MKTIKQKTAVLVSLGLSLAAFPATATRAQDTAQAAWDESSRETTAVLGMALSGTSGERGGVHALVSAESSETKPGYWGLHGPARHDGDDVSLIEKAGALGHLINVATSPIGAAKLHVNAIADAKGFWQTAAQVAAIVFYPFTLLAAVGTNVVGGFDDAFSGIGVWLHRS